jgi:hypothetical protein
MSRPDCYYCGGTGVDDEADRLDVDDYRSGPCDLCEGTGIATHSANTDTTRKPRDLLSELSASRRYRRKAGIDNGFDPYLNVKSRAIGAEPAGFAAMAMCERAIRCELACRDAVQAWRAAA